MAHSMLGCALLGQALTMRYECASALFRRRQKNSERAADEAAGLDAGGAVGALERLRASLLAAYAAEAAAVAALAGLALAPPPDASVATEAGAAEALLRGGAAAAGAAVLEACAGAAALVDGAALSEVARIEAALRGGTSGGLAAALDWAAAWASRLRRLPDCHLPYDLGEARFLELVRAGDVAGAMAYAQHVLAPLAREGPPARALQRAVVAAVYATPARCGVPEVEALFSPARAADLADAFRRDALRALGCVPAPPLLMAVVVGVALLKTPACRPGGSIQPPSSGCPLCATPAVFADLIATSASCTATHSSLRCPITGELLDEHNAALVLPSGRVFGARTLELCTSGDKGTVVCPRTGELFAAQQVRRAFFLN